MFLVMENGRSPGRSKARLVRITDNERKNAESEMFNVYKNTTDVIREKILHEERGAEGALASRFQKNVLSRARY